MKAKVAAFVQDLDYAGLSVGILIGGACAAFQGYLVWELFGKAAAIRFGFN